jgi:hypothetical protein
MLCESQKRCFLLLIELKYDWPTLIQKLDVYVEYKVMILLMQPMKQ